MAWRRPKGGASMEHVNDQLFLAINAGAHPPGFALLIALFLANWLAPLCLGLYENGIRLCRLPPALFPRRIPSPAAADPAEQALFTPAANRPRGDI